MSKLIYYDYKPKKNIEKFDTSIIIDNTITQETFNTQQSNITSCGSIIIDNSILTNITLNKLVSCEGISIVNNNNLTTIEMLLLNTIQNKLMAKLMPDKFSDIIINDNNKLTILNMPNIKIINNITINNNNLNNLNGLKNVETINGSLIISNNNNLITLADLNLKKIKNTLEISNNNLLDMNKIQSGLTNITTLNDLTISDNNNLTSLEELRNIKTINGNFIIKNNKNLKTLYNLSGLYSIDGNFEITNNAMLDICKTSLLTLDDLKNNKIPTYPSIKNNLVGILPNYLLCANDKFTLPISVNLDDALSAAYFRIKYSEYFEVIGSNFDSFQMPDVQVSICFEVQF